MHILEIFCLANAAEEELEIFIKHHLKSSHVCVTLFLDNPDHMAFDCLKKFDDRLKIVPCDEKHWKKLLGRMPKDMPEKQHANIEFGAQLARSRGSKFAISIDHDELIHPLSDLTDFLKGEGLNSKVDLYRVSPLEAIFELPVDTLSTPFEARWFRVLLISDLNYKRRIQRLSFWLAVRLRLMNLFSRRGFLGHTQGKTVFRLSTPFTKWGQHNQKSDVVEILENKFDSTNILHFDAMSYDHWYTKWHRRTLGDTKATAISKGRKLQTKLSKFAIRFERFGLAKFLFKFLYAFRQKSLLQMRNHKLVVKIEWDK